MKWIALAVGAVAAVYAVGLFGRRRAAATIGAQKIPETTPSKKKAAAAAALSANGAKIKPGSILAKFSKIPIFQEKPIVKPSS